MLTKPETFPEKDTQTTHQSGLLRHIGVFAAVTVVMSSMIGSGVFKKIAPMSDGLQSPGLVLLAWLLAGIVTLMGSLTNAEIAGLIAEPGGQYVYFRRMYGKMFAFLYGWACFAVIQSASQASIAYVFAHSVNTLVPLPQLSPELEAFSLFGVIYPLKNFGVKILTVCLLCLLTTVNYRGVKYGSSVSAVFTSSVVLCIFTIVILGLTISGGSMDNIATNASGFDISRVNTSTSGLLGAMFTAMVSAFWAYDGWNNLSFLGGEVKNPKRTIPLALGIGVSLVTGIYLLINFTYLYVMPIDEMIAVFNTPNTIAAVEVVKKIATSAENFFGIAHQDTPSILSLSGITFISTLILLATFGSTNSSILSTSRVYFAMAKDGLFFKKAAYCHPVYKTPSIALLMQCTWSCILVFSGSFDQLTDMLIFAAFIFYGAGAFGVFVLRRKMPDAPRPYKAIGYPVLPALFVLCCIALVTVSLLERPLQSLTGLFLILTGLPFYLSWKKNIV
ncbi:amino acid permease [Rhodocytophaga rosea]|uniref:Amino acid permease n=1 Tax=Rhodocytophaga rosea TaxID=2704465 RepID=A0A6C0GT72_9BACT|nr:amino acid permease [Rhodocytophaga rosea]QHT71368.1 amino acid permease [Rhodocytophaga rosea]